MSYEESEPISPRRPDASTWWAGVTLLIVTIVLATTACSGGRAGSADAPEGSPVVGVAVQKVERADLSQGLRIAAEFRPFQEIDVHAKVAGYVKKIYVDVGDRVRAGQPLAILEVPELEAELDQAAAALRQSEREVERAQNELKRAEADYSVAHLAYARLKGVSASRPNLVAQQEVDDAQGKDQAAEAQSAAAKSALAGAREHFQNATANRQRVQSLLDYSKITAPFDGIVTSRYADTGAMLASGTSSEKQALPLVRLSQNGLLRLEIPVPETNVPAVRLGKKVSVEVPALQKIFQGIVARFAGKVDSSTRTMMTEVDVANPRFRIVPGMYAYVSFPIEEKRNALAVPIQAISRQGDAASAYRVNRENRIEVLPVTVGMETRNEIEVLSGLSEGDRVVVGNTSQLRQGQVVVPKLVQVLEPKGGR
jgi:RND family efflux transporter MFP subunit